MLQITWQPIKKTHLYFLDWSLEFDDFFFFPSVIPHLYSAIFAVREGLSFVPQYLLDYPYIH